MAPLGPFARDRKVVVGVSGGADSMALAFLLRHWGEPLAVIVDHGLRRESHDEAALTQDRLRTLGIPAVIVAIPGLRTGAGLASRARAARYEALFQLCREHGRPDLLVAHHRQDQIETVQLRAASGSGRSGLAGMAAVSWRGPARILRPLLGIDPDRLRATLRQAGVEWVEDPGNRDPRTARGALRQRPADPGAAARADEAGRRRSLAEAELGAELARVVSILPGGYARIDGTLSPAAWSALIWTISGRPHPPAPAAVARLAQAGSGTLHGVQVRAGLAGREPAATTPPVAATAGACWDGRFVLGSTVPGAVLGTRDEPARLHRRTKLPSCILRSLPCLRPDKDLLALERILYPDAETCPSVRVEFRPARPLAGQPFGVRVCA